MVRRIAFIVLLICLVWQGVVGAVELELKPKLACLPFVSLNVEAMAIAENMSSVLANSIDRSGYFETVDRRKIEGTIELAGLKFNNLTTDDLYRVGREAGLDFLVSGTVKRAGSGMTVEVRLLSMRAGKIYYADTFQASDYEIVGRMQQVTAEIILKTKECILEGQAASQEKLKPSAPFGVEISGTSSSLRLKWQHADCSPAVVFKVFRSAREGGPFVHIATRTEPAYTDGNLRVNETFFYRIKSVNPHGAESEFSQTVMGKTALAPPPPILLSVDADVKGAVLSWRPRPSGDSDSRTVVAGYRVYRKGAGEKEFIERARCSSETIVYRDTGLAEMKHYTYAVVSFNSDSTESEFSTPLDVTAVPAVDGVRVEAVRKRRVVLRWAPSSSERIEGYVVYRSERQDKGYERVGSLEGRGMSSHADLAPESSKTYWYRITAYNREGAETSPGLTVAANTEGKLPVPTGITAISGQTRKVTLYWQPAGTPADGIKGYNVYRAEDSMGPYRLVGEVPAMNTSFTDEGGTLRNGTMYFYKVGSYDDGGDLSPLSEPVEATTKGGPRPPNGLKAVSGEVRQVTLRWESNPEPDIEKYEIYRGPADETSVTMIDSVTGTSYVDRGLSDGAAYNYAVKAVNKEGMSSLVSTAVTSQTRPLPKKPAGIQVVQRDGGRMITWESSSDRDVRCYNLYRKGFMGMLEKLATVETSSWRIDNLQGEVELFIKAQDDTGRESEGAAILLPR